ncbi:MAG TPA: hypothetical protein VFU95_11365 [Telluria sp.]|nr:hypothetical protein [Telluria sp.]
MANPPDTATPHEHHLDPANMLQEGLPIRPRKSAADMSHIQGWGADLDLKNRPAVPMERTPPRLDHPLPVRIEQQRTDIPVLVSPERPSITPVYGTSVPPSGLSGMIRAAAFRSTENDLRHWLLLMVADRVNVVEGIIDDLSRGHVPNVLGEMGIKAEWKHNPAGVVKKAAVAGAVIGAAWYMMSRPKRR